MICSRKLCISRSIPLTLFYLCNSFLTGKSLFCVARWRQVVQKYYLKVLQISDVTPTTLWNKGKAQLSLGIVLDLNLFYICFWAGTIQLYYYSRFSRSWTALWILDFPLEPILVMPFSDIVPSFSKGCIRWVSKQRHVTVLISILILY